MAVQLDYLQALIARDDVFVRSSPDARPHGPVGLFEAVACKRARRWGIDAVRVLVAVGVVSWSTVAVETWLLVR